MIGIPIAPGSKYDYVDSVRYQTAKLKYGGGDLQAIQDSGVHIIILNNKYPSTDLDSARSSCAGPPLATIKILGVSGYPDDAGFRVASVTPDSPAALAYLHPGDVVSKIDGHEVHTGPQIETALATSLKPSVKITCLVQTAAVGIISTEREARLR